MRKLNVPQRVVVVVALGFVCLGTDAYMTPRSSGGWFAYAPNTDVVYAPGGAGAGHLALRVLLAVAWATASVFILRTPKE